MKIITRSQWLLLITITGLVAFLFITENDTSEINEFRKVSEVTLATSSLPVAVSGVVKAADEATIYAKTPGVVNEIMHREGAVVSSGIILAAQDTPVEYSQIALAQAQSELIKSQQVSQISAVEANSKRSIVQAYTASEIAALRAKGNDSRIAETTAMTAAAVKMNVAVILSVMDYINNNRSLLTADGLKNYNEAVRLTYGNKANYFDANFLTKSTVVSTTTLKALGDKADTSLITAETSASLTAKVLTLLNDALVGAEEDVFERDGSQDNTTTSEYLAKKVAVTTALANMEDIRSSAKQMIDSILEDSVDQKAGVDVSTIDQEEASVQAALALEIAARSSDVATAAIGVARAQASLGVITAPFAGLISKVFVKEGEYVLPGTPLFKLVGTGAKELFVTVPSVFKESLAVGQSFIVEGKEVGVVDRFSPVSEGSGQVVIIALTEDLVSVGSTQRGHILMNDIVGLYKVPRAYVHFTSDGTSIVYRGNERADAEIIYDDGDNIFIRTNNVKSDPLTPAVLMAQ